MGSSPIEDNISLDSSVGRAADCSRVLTHGNLSVLGSIPGQEMILFFTLSFLDFRLQMCMPVYNSHFHCYSKLAGHLERHIFNTYKILNMGAARCINAVNGAKVRCACLFVIKSQL